MANSHSPTPDGSPPDIQIVGYSERGVFNSLFYEIGFHPDRRRLLADLLHKITFHGTSSSICQFRRAEILIEQSFSDFGDADAVILLEESEQRRQVVFIEGKVSAQSSRWTIDDAWRNFLRRTNGKLNSSNLFTQLYHKVRFISELKSGGLSRVSKGVPFPACSTKTVRKIGRNPVVCRAAQLVEKYANESFFVAVVPDSPGRVARFFAQQLQQGPGQDIPEWDTRGWGHLTWGEVEQFCQSHQLENTLRVFHYNQGQIY